MNCPKCNRALHREKHLRAFSYWCSKCGVLIFICRFCGREMNILFNLYQCNNRRCPNRKQKYTARDLLED